MKSVQGITRVARGLLLFLFAVSLVVSFPGAASAVTSTQSIALPVYEYPTLTNLWPSVDAAGSSIPFVVVNPASGPGSSTNSDYTSRIAANTAKGIRSIGYVDTNYQTRSMADVASDIDAWHTLYPGISGILFDRVSVGGASDLCYSAYSYNFAKSRYPNDLLSLNFGTYTSPAYEPYGDIFLNAEMDYALYQTWSLPTDGFQDNPAYSNRFWHLIHTTTAGANYTDALTDTRNNNAGWVYITDDILPNPYDAAPSYFSTELTDVATLPPSIIPNRGVTSLPAGCMDMSLASTSNQVAGTTTSSHTITNTSSTYTAFSPNKIAFALPTGVTLASATGTNWTCTGTDCSYSDDLSPAETSGALSASFSADCSYTSGDVTVTATTFGSTVDTSTVAVQRPTDCPSGSAGTLAETGSNGALITAFAILGSLIGTIVLYRSLRKPL